MNFMAQAKKTTKKKKAVAKQVSHAKAYIQATFNNTIVSVTDQNGDVLGWASAGQVVKKVVENIKDCGVKEVSVFVKGIGGGREGAIRGFNSNGVSVVSIKDVTPIPHNGCRPPKRRRV